MAKTRKYKKYRKSSHKYLKKSRTTFRKNRRSKMRYKKPRHLRKNTKKRGRIMRGGGVFAELLNREGWEEHNGTWFNVARDQSGLSQINALMPIKPIHFERFLESEWAKAEGKKDKPWIHKLIKPPYCNCMDSLSLEDVLKLYLQKEE